MAFWYVTCDETHICRALSLYSNSAVRSFISSQGMLRACTHKERYLRDIYTRTPEAVGVSDLPTEYTS